MTSTVFNYTIHDDITEAAATIPARPGDMVTVTFSGAWHNAPDYIVQDGNGNAKRFPVVAQGGKLGIMYPGRDFDGIWHDAQFTPFDLFSWTVNFEIVTE